MRRAIALCILVSLSTACIGPGATTAMIYKAGGGSIEADVYGSDAGSIYYGTPEDAREQTISRGEVADIDHPGDQLALVLLGLATAGAGANALQCQTDCWQGWTGVGATGLLGLYYGFLWMRSSDRARQP